MAVAKMAGVWASDPEGGERAGWVKVAEVGKLSIEINVGHCTMNMTIEQARQLAADIIEIADRVAERSAP